MENIKKKSKLTAGLLGIFLGTFGIHNFYVGSYAKAIIQLLITVLSFGMLWFISAIWGVAEGILILCDVTDVNEEYRKQNATLEDNKKFVETTLKRYGNNKKGSIPYIVKHSNLSLEEANILCDEVIEINHKKNTKKEILQNNNDKSNSNTNIIVHIISIVIVCVIVFGVFKGISGIYNFLTAVDGSTGKNLAIEFFEINKNVPNLYIDTMYSIGYISRYDNATILKNNEEKYIFKITISYNPKLNNGSTDLTRERTGTTYIAYNHKTGKYQFYTSLEKAENSDIWRSN